MSVILNTHEVHGLTVLDLAGRFTILDQSLRETVRQSLNAGKYQFILKMNEVTYIDSCGLGELVHVYNSVRHVGGNLRLLSPSERVRQLLNISKLDTVFDILEDAGPFLYPANGEGMQNSAS